MRNCLDELIKCSKKYNIDEKIELINEFQRTKDLDIANDIIAGYYKMIIKNANAIKNSSAYKNLNVVSVEDLVNSCIIGVHQSLHKVNTDYKYAIDSYVMNWGREHMYREVRKLFGAVMTPSTKLANLRKLDKIVSKYDGDLDLAVDEFYSGENIGIAKKEKLKSLYNNKVSSVSINDENSESEGMTFSNVLVDNTTQSIDEMYRENELNNIINESMESVLDSDERNIVRQYYGFDSAKKMTYKEIASKLNLKQVNVYHSTKKAISKLKSVDDLKLYK